MKLQEALQQAMKAHQAGDLRRAEAIYRGILSHEPDHPDALNLLGVVTLQNGRLGEAADLIARAIGRVPTMPLFHFNMGLVLAASGKLDGAVAEFRQAIVLEPTLAAAWSRMGDALYESNHPKEAEEACRKAIELQPGLPDAHNALGKAQRARGDLAGAIASFRQAAALMPQFAQACSNLGQTLCESGEFEESVVWCRRAIGIQPEYGLAHWNLALMLLRRGEWEEGWREFEWRWRSGKMQMLYRQPMWDGSELNGRRILLHAEQGLGDTIQFVRYVPMVASRGGRITVAAQRELLPLLRQMEGVEKWLGPGDALEELAIQCPLGSLPGLFKTTAESVPGEKAYLRADAQRAAKWRERMESYAGKRVGLAWTGNPQNPDDRNRSFSPAVLGPLAEVKETAFFSLQKGEGVKQAGEAPMRLIDWTDELNDLADTAGLIENLDVVITADTVVAHLAGAMGKPVWILLPKVPDWRWGLERADSPWYPAARLFRQDVRGDWTGPVKQAADALRAL
jgi:tetratricopeptide (TPR) repeat protein